MATPRNLTSQRNYWWLADTAYVGVISGSSAGNNTTLTMSSFNNDNFGNGRIAIVQEKVLQALTITGVSYPTLNGQSWRHHPHRYRCHVYALRYRRSFESGISITPSSSNPLAAAKSLSLYDQRYRQRMRRERYADLPAL